MPLDALAFALAAACTHASWNLILAGRRDSQAATAVALMAAIVLVSPVIVVTWGLEAAALPYLIVSGTFTLGYVLLLSAAYHRAELSLVYPLARGIGPVVALVGAWLVLGERPSVGEALGVLVVAGGIVLVRGVRGGGGDPVGVLMAAGIGVCIGSSVLLDQRGLEHAEPLTFATLALVPATVAQAASVARVRGTTALRAELDLAVVAAGVLCLGSYVLFLQALDRGPAGPLAAARETSVVVATVLAALVLREGVTRGRMAGAFVVVAGVALLSLT